jgi:hypothetical protein
LNDSRVVLDVRAGGNLRGERGNVPRATGLFKISGGLELMREGQQIDIVVSIRQSENRLIDETIRSVIEVVRADVGEYSAQSLSV